MKLLTLITLPFFILSLSACQTMNTLPLNKAPEQTANVQPAIVNPKTPTVSELESYSWRLSHVSESNGEHKIFDTLKEPMHKGNIVLNFAQNRMSFSVGCNQISNLYSLTNDVLTVKGNAASTLMACDDLESAESMLVRLLQGDSKLKIDANRGAVLNQVIDGKTTLTWHGTLKPEAKYGKGETLFLEVRPVTKACNTLTDRPCLEVREITYNAEGIKTGVGAWKVLYEPIDGFRQQPNLQQVLRVQRYRTPPADTMGYGNVYVLDTIIESQTIK